jgi:hypothetical protein
MKRLYISLSLVLLVIAGFGQPQLTWRVENPRIIRTGGFDFLEFEIQVKADANGTYCDAMQANFTYDLTALGTSITFTKAGISSGVDGFGSNDKYDVTVNYNGGAINVFVNSPNTYDPASHDPITDWFNEVTTDWQPLVIAKCRILNNTLTPNLVFKTTFPGMNTNEFYVSPGIPGGGISYNATNLIDNTKSLQGIFLQRMFSGKYNWSQVGGPTNNVQFVNWATSGLNTSVFDTLASAPYMGDGTNKNITVAKMNVLNTARLVVPVDRSVTATGVTEFVGTNGALKLESNATQFGQFIDNGVTYTGGAKAWAYRGVTQGMWHMLSIPMQSVMARESFLNYFLQYWLEPANTWKQVLAMPNDTALATQGLGYFLWSDPLTPPTSGTIKHVGQLNTGSIAYSNITHTGALNGYNLLGNPYPSSVDLLSAGITWGAGLDQVIWIWDPIGGSYSSYAIGSGGTHSQYVPPQQGIWVHKAAEGGTTSLTFQNSARVINTENFIKDEVSDLLYLGTSCSSKPYYDKAMIRFMDVATAGYDRNFDAQLMRGGTETPQIYSLISDTEFPALTVNALPWTGTDQEIPLGFDCGVSGTYTLTVSNIESFREGTILYLQDLLNGHTQNLNMEPAYTFDYEAGADPGRFLLLFSNPYFAINDNSNPTLRIFSYSHDFYVKNTGNQAEGDVALFDIAGRKVFGSRLQPMAVNRYTPNVTSGFYVVRVITGSQVTTEKVYIQ